jgi:hypothetical protein
MLEEYDDMSSLLIACLDRVIEAERPDNSRTFHESLCLKVLCFPSPSVDQFEVILGYRVQWPDALKAALWKMVSDPLV